MSVSNLPAAGPIEDLTADGPTAVYRLYGEDGALLYVGVSSAPKARWAQHRADKAWWPEVRRYTIEWADNRAAALVHEAEAIRSETPRYNVVGTDKHRARITAARRFPLGGSEAARGLVEAIEAFAAIEDPMERAAAVSEVLTRWQELPSRLREIRQTTVRELRDEHGMKWAEIAQLLGGISAARAQQIAQGLSGHARTKREALTPER
ncbi:GIY-YIG nuclease family protein [Streptomyces variabilis]